MKRVLITGMSGTGKSSVIEELRVRGYQAYDFDTPEWSEWVTADDTDVLTPAQGRDWVWQVERVRTLLSNPGEEPLFVSGCATNMGQFYPLLDMVILLSAPVDNIMERLAARSQDNYGYIEEERAKVAELISTVEPLLRQSADHEIDTGKPTPVTVDEILRLANCA